MTTQANQCLIWGPGVEGIATRHGFDTMVEESARADGSYRITRLAELMVHQLEPVQKAKLTTWVVDQHLQGEELPLITTDIIEYAITRPSLQVHVRAFRLLHLIAQQTRAIGTKPIPRWDVHFGGLEDDREDSTAPHITFRPQWAATGSAV